MSQKFNEKFYFSLMYFLSLRRYGNLVDDKKMRSSLDILNGKIINKRNFVYNKSTKQWEQVSNTMVLQFEVRTDPISYKKNDTIKIHKYPVIFQFKDFEKGFKTPFKWREGGFKKPILRAPGMSSKTIANKNIINQTQLQFFFEMEFLAKVFNLLYGVCRAKRFPNKKNPKKLLYFGKHAYFISKKFIIPILSNDSLKRKLIKNLNRS